MKRVIVALVLLGAVVGITPVWADDEQPAGEGHDEQPSAAADEQHEPSAAPADEHHEAPAAPADEHHEQPAAPTEEQHAGPAAHAPEATHESATDEPAAHPTDAADDDDVPYNKFDLDGDGTSDPALEHEWAETTAGFSANIDEAAVDAALDARPEDAELMPSISAEQFRKIVALVKKVVLGKMEAKMARSAAKKMSQFSLGIFCFSLLGFGLLFVPLALRKKYPGKGSVLFKYAALAAVTFFLTVNLFGGVLYGMKTAQGALGDKTNPSLAIASGTFDTLYDNADDYITMGKELFVPTLMQLEGNSDEQPAAIMIQNGIKIVHGAKVFVSIAKMFKKLNVVFAVLPIILFCVTMILFGLAIRPTLTEIVKLPMRAAAGEAGVGRDTTKLAIRRIWSEVLATLCTLGVLTVLTFVSAAVLGQIVKPALDALLSYFSLSVTYLQFVDAPSSGIVFLTLFSVVLFLALNLATLILSMSFFLGKCQKIFQARFNDHTPVATHKRFFQWGIPSVLFVQLFPLAFVFVAGRALDKINESLLAGIKDADAVPWAKILLAGPFFLVVAYALMFWGARGVKAMTFLFSYKVKPKLARKNAPPHMAEPI
jgi:hypothetical protein